MDRMDDINVAGGWLVQAHIPGDPPHVQHYYVYDLDKEAAIERIRAAHANDDTACRAIRPLNNYELTGFGLAPGEAKRHQ
jgi:hypothetical protein